MSIARVFIGIDPGKGGGIAYIDGTDVDAIKMPEENCDIGCFVERLVKHTLSTIVIEQVHASQQMGVSSAFTFGVEYGRLQGLFAGIGLDLNYVTPQKWQAALNCRTGGDKKISKRKAEELFPNKKITLATADALLLAYYAWITYGK